MRTRLPILALLLAAFLITPVGNVEACGPFFEPEVFVSTTTPDDVAAFAQGRLGILQAGYDSSEYAVAFRYLIGGTLSIQEQSAIEPPSPNPDLETPQQWQAEQAALAAAAESTPPKLWVKARAQYVPATMQKDQQPSLPADNAGNITIDGDYLNCPDAAFANATRTLKARADAWGNKSPWLADWIHAQDAVFSNCAGKSAAMPSPAASASPAPLKADRAYQTASATFYAKQFDDAAKQFAAIAADHTSPWSSWGDYLAARATVRKAFAMGKATDPYGGDLASFDTAAMQRAQQMLEALLAQPSPAPSRAVIQSELNFVRIRTEPEERATEICAALVGPRPDPNFSQDLQDLNFLLVKHVGDNSQSPLLLWIGAWRGAGSAASAFDAWRPTRLLPWLVVAMAKADPTDPFVSQLLDDAAKVAPDSAAYDTVFFHRVRLLIALKRTDEARGLLDAALPALKKQKPGSELNALLGERMAVARNFDEFLEFAPRTTLETGSEAADDLQAQCNAMAHAVNAPAPCPEADHPQEFDQDAVEILNQQAPVSLLIRAAQSLSLPQNLRRELAIVAWTRAVLLDDTKSAATVAPLLPKSLQDTADLRVDFPADLAILRNPGIRPYLEAGIPRVASFSTFDGFRDNGWCKTWSGAYAAEQAAPALPPPPAFFMPDQTAQGAAEVQRLQQMPDSTVLIGQRILDYAKDHPDDPQAPEALALTVRASHYSCQTWNPKIPPASQPKYQPVSKAAFEFLRQHYPKSPWTAKTPYYY